MVGTRNRKFNSLLRLYDLKSAGNRNIFSFLCRYGIRHWCRIADKKEKISLVLLGLVVMICGVHLKKFLFGRSTGRNGDILAGLSYQERRALRQFVQNFPSGKKVLLAWPSIPVAFKGSDSRPIDAIRTLTSMGFEVDLMYWRDYADEIYDENYNDMQDRLRVIEAGVNRIMGPYDTLRQNRQNGGVVPLPSAYAVFLYWLWPNGDWLSSLLELSLAVKQGNAQAGVIAAVDDRGIALRVLQGALTNNNRSVDEVEQLLISMTRFQAPPDNSETSGVSAPWDLQNEFNQQKLVEASYLLNVEMRLYYEATMVIGINDATVSFLKKVSQVLLLCLLNSCPISNSSDSQIHSARSTIQSS